LRNITQRRPPDSDVRSSIQSTAAIPASAAWSSGLRFSPSPGRGGFGWSAEGSGGDGSLGRRMV
jgi:hypothetical protein